MKSKARERVRKYNVKSEKVAPKTKDKRTNEKTQSKRATLRNELQHLTQDYYNEWPCLVCEE